MIDPLDTWDDREPESRRTVHILAVFFLLGMSGLGLMFLSPEATAISWSEHHYGFTGYMGGSSTVYMTTAITDTAKAPVIPTLYAQDSEASWEDWQGVRNALNVTAGQPRSPTPGAAVFAYYYQAFAPKHLIINVPIAMAGGTDLVFSPTELNTVRSETITLSQSGAAGVTTLFRTQYNSGYNVSAPGPPGNSLDVNLLKLGVDAAGYLPGVNFYTTTASLMMDAMEMVGTAACGGTPYLTGDGSTCQWWGVDFDPNKNRNVFTAQTYIEIDIPRESFTTILPTFTITAQNWVGAGVVAVGAQASVGFNAVPAVEITGKVYAAGSPLANREVVLLTSESGYDLVWHYYHLNTDQDGRYRFFGKLGKGYTVSTSYQTPFGLATVQQSLTTPTSPDGITQDLIVPSLAGYVRSSVSPNNPISGAAVTVASPSGSTYTTSTDSNGYYSVTVKDFGAYSLTARAYGYAVQTRSQSVSANAAFSVPDFNLIPQTPVFSLSTCGSVSVFTSSSGQCSVSVTSIAGWSGTVTLSATISPVVSGGPTISGVSPVTVTVTSFGQTTSFVTISAGTATGTFTVTVVGTSGSLSRSATFTVTVSNPPPPPRCTPQRCPT